jgi:hypothetical protein
MDAERTNVTGYFNPHAFPISLNSPSIGLVQVIKPGGFVVDRQGIKINDPQLDRFVGQNRLSRETTTATDGVAVRRLAKPGERPASQSSVIAVPASPAVHSRDNRPNAVTPITRAPGHALISDRKMTVVNPDTTGKESAPRPVVSARTIAEAEKLGYLGRARPTVDNLDKLSVLGSTAVAARKAQGNLPSPTISASPTTDGISNPVEETTVDVEPVTAAQLLKDAGVPPRQAPAPAEPVQPVAESVELPAPQLDEVPAPSPVPAAKPASRGVPTAYANLERGAPVMVTVNGALKLAKYIGFNLKYNLPEVNIDGKKNIRKIVRIATEEDISAARAAQT